MNPELISRVIGLVEKHGDRVVLADQQTGKAVVVLDLPAYEKLLAGGSAALSEPKSAARAVPAVQPEISPTEKPQLFSINSKKKAKISDFSINELKFPISAKEPVAGPNLADLTQEELLDKINRDIGTWKTVQESKRTEELKAAFGVAPLARAQILEEEERFYLEPIE